jgi:hypothetical protein
MNQKTAKRLRKIAFGMVVAAEEKGKTVQKVAYTQDRKTGQIRVASATWKGVYKALKRAFKTGSLPRNAVAPAAPSL